MPIDLMLVDDSAVIRGLLAKVLETETDIRIVATASDGKMAVELAKRHQPHVMTLDIEMPNMDGLTALPLILQASPKTKVIMVSTLSVRNAEVTMKALAMGAADYIPKPTARVKEELELFYIELRSKIKALASKTTKPAIAAPSVATTTAAKPAISLAKNNLNLPVKVVAIASSTGGPQALMTVFQGLVGRLKHLPILITQHMPPTFTKVLADNIVSGTRFPCKEATAGDKVLPGQAYIAPGGYHMLIEKNGVDVVITTNQNPPVNFCRPAADPMFESISKIYGANVLAVVLTGMGQDGMEGAKIIANAGGTVIAQSEETCSVYGMPRAVVEAGLCQSVLPLNQIADYIVKRCG